MATQIIKVARGRTASGAQVPGATYRTGGRDSVSTDGAGSDSRGRPAAMEVVYLALSAIYRVFGARRMQFGAGLTVKPLDDGETVVVQTHPLADPVAASRWR